MSYKDRLRSTKTSSESELNCNSDTQCCNNPCIESRDGDNVCLNCGLVIERK